MNCKYQLSTTPKKIDERNNKENNYKIKKLKADCQIDNALAKNIFIFNDQMINFTVQYTI